MSVDPIAGKVVAITGASSGIGEATARLLAGRGARLILGARRTDRLETTADDLRAENAAVVVAADDVTSREQVQHLVDQAVDHFGRLDVLVSNAGISKIGPVADGDVDGWSAMIDVNVRGVLYGIAAAMPVFRRQGAGHFVTTVSTAGLKIVPDMGVYAATKNAVRTVMEALRQESTDGVIRTTSISPGFVRTELAESIDDASLRAQIRSNMDEFGLAPEAVAEPSRSPSSNRTTSRSATSPFARPFKADAPSPANVHYRHAIAHESVSVIHVRQTRHSSETYEKGACRSGETAGSLGHERAGDWLRRRPGLPALAGCRASSAGAADPSSPSCGFPAPGS